MNQKKIANAPPTWAANKRFLNRDETKPKPLTNKKELHLVWLGGQNAQ